MSAVAGLGEVARKALSQLAQFGQLKTIGNGQTIGASCTTERRERERSIVKREGTRQRTRRPCAPPLEGTRQGTRCLLAGLPSSREQDRETNGLINGLGTRTPSAAHQTIENAAESGLSRTFDDPGPPAELAPLVSPGIVWLSHLWILWGPSSPGELFPGPAV
jgi:hypothetical protein